MQFDPLKRRQFITLPGGAAAGWPLAEHAQQPERVRRIGVLHNRAADDALGQARHGAFLQGLQQAGWTIGRNVQVGDPLGRGPLATVIGAAAKLTVQVSGVGRPYFARYELALRREAGRWRGCGLWRSRNGRSGCGVAAPWASAGGNAD